MHLSPAAREVLGTVAASLRSGPHHARALRRYTRLTGAAYDEALAELAAAGLVQRRDGDCFWLTRNADDALARLFL